MVDYKGELEKRGIEVFDSGSKYFMMCCPFHDDENPSFSVSSATGSYRCFSGSCGRNGSFADLISKLDRISVKEAVRKLGLGDTVQDIVSYVDKVLDEGSENIIKFYSYASFCRVFEPVKGTKGEAYLLSRNITKKAMRRFRVRWAGEGRFCGRVIFPVFMVDGSLLAYIGRAVDKDRARKVKASRSCERTLFGFYELLKYFSASKNKKLPYIILVEGIIDAVYLQQFGIPAVARMCTALLSEYQLKLLKHYGRKVVLSYDGDEGGNKAAAKQIPILRKHLPVLSLRLPEGKDPNNLFGEEVEKFYGKYYVRSI